MSLPSESDQEWSQGICNQHSAFSPKTITRKIFDCDRERSASNLQEEIPRLSSRCQRPPPQPRKSRLNVSSLYFVPSTSKVLRFTNNLFLRLLKAMAAEAKRMNTCEYKFLICNENEKYRNLVQCGTAMYELCSMNDRHHRIRGNNGEKTLKKMFSGLEWIERNQGTFMAFKVLRRSLRSDRSTSLPGRQSYSLPVTATLHSQSRLRPFIKTLSRPNVAKLLRNHDSTDRCF